MVGGAHIIASGNDGSEDRGRESAFTAGHGPDVECAATVLGWGHPLLLGEGAAAARDSDDMGEQCQSSRPRPGEKRPQKPVSANMPPHMSVPLAAHAARAGRIGFENAATGRYVKDVKERKASSFLFLNHPSILPLFQVL